MPHSTPAAAEHLMPWFDREEPADGVVRQHFEWNSRGSRVVADLFRPADQETPLPLVLLCGPTGAARRDEGVAAEARMIAGLSRTVAVVELPLHGERGNPKLTPRLLDTLSNPPQPIDAALWEDLLAQTMADLGSALTVLTAHPRVAASPTVFVGTGLGAALGAHFCADEPRVRACALAGLEGVSFPAPIKPEAAIRGIAPRDVLLRSSSDPDGGSELGTFLGRVA